MDTILKKNPGEPITLAELNQLLALADKFMGMTALPPLYLIRTKARTTLVYSPDGPPDDLPGGGADGSITFVNGAQTYQATCPAGSFGYSVSGGVATGEIGGNISQAAVDALALELASDRALVGLSCSVFSVVTTDGHINTMALGPSGKIYIAGFFRTIFGVDRTSLATLDLGLNLLPECWKLLAATTPEVQSVDYTASSGGMVFVTGSFTQAETIATAKVARLNVDGSVNGAFTAPAMTFFAAQTLSAKCDGSDVMIFGNLSTVGGSIRNGIARLDNTGALNTGFAPPVNFVGQQIEVWDCVPSGGQYYVAAGYLFHYGTPSQRATGVVRLNGNGSLDTTWEPDCGNATTAISLSGLGLYVNGIGLWSLGVGFSTAAGIARLDPGSGAFDATFDANAGTGIFEGGSYGTINSLAVHNGGLVLGGDFDSYNGHSVHDFVRINSDGTFDNTFINPVFDNTVSKILVDVVDNSIVVCGEFANVNGIARAGICKLDVSGNLLS